MVVASFTIVLYELIITFEYQYEFVWRRKRTIATWLFLANRYSLLAVLVAQVVTYSAALPALVRAGMLLLLRPPDDLINDDLSILLSASVCVVGPGVCNLCDYIYARFSRHDRAKSVYDWQSQLVLFGLPAYGPAVLPRLDDVSFDAVLLTANAFTITAELIAVVTTWIKIYRHIREASSIGINLRFSKVLLQYGKSSHLSAHHEHNRLPHIALARFVINLRHVKASESSTAPPLSRFSVVPIHFHVSSLTSIIGDLREPLEHSDLEEVLGHEEDFTYEDRGSIAPNAEPHQGQLKARNASSDEIQEVPRDWLESQSRY
ncbi:hypothetical protein NM688_g1900 [Phlebia brevispora]|uniref:Uncharacterized protein n=1 Tax=Phlebia brevispora TaxID=194682 RepID=A0ACC1TA78_9APHY|nr:hypothetical protein NM688_g1900 [Phlebia brevispora]